MRLTKNDLFISFLLEKIFIFAARIGPLLTANLHVLGHLIYLIRKVAFSKQKSKLDVRTELISKLRHISTGAGILYSISVAVVIILFTN